MKKIEEILTKVGTTKFTLSRGFHEATKIKKFGEKVDFDKWPENWKKIFYKGYPRLSQKRLVRPKPSRKKQFGEVLNLRKSSRKFSKEALGELELSTLLFYSAGIKVSKSGAVRRFYPSAGGRYPLEIYPIVLNMKNVKSGVYHYYLKAHSLEELWVDPQAKKKAIEAFSEPWVKGAAVLILISAVFARNQIKYGDRGYRHVLLEAGHLAQNFYLLASALSLACCEVGGFIDEKLNNILDLDSDEESVITVIAVGPRK